MAGIVFSKSSGLNDSIYGKSQEPIMAFIETRNRAKEEGSLVKEMFKMVDSKHFGEKFTSLTQLANGFQPVGEGGAYPVDERQEGFSKFLESDTWKDSFAVTQEMIEDNLLMDIKASATAFVDAYHLTRERYAAAFIMAAVTGSGSFRGKTIDYKSNDNVSLFSTAHPSCLDSNITQSNKFAGAFSADVLAAIETRMQNFKDDNSEELTVAPTTIIIPNDAMLKKAVFEAIGADKAPDTANNGFNYLCGRYNVIVNPYLNGLLTNDNSDKPFFLFDKNYNEDYNGLLFLDRIPLTVKSYIHEGTDNNIWAGRSRFVCGANDWREIAVGGVTGGTELTEIPSED